MTPCTTYTLSTYIDTCVCNCRTAYSVPIPDIHIETQCQTQCSSQFWCVMYSYIKDECTLYSNTRPCTTCTNATGCDSGCVGRPAYQKSGCPPPLPPYTITSPSPPPSVPPRPSPQATQSRCTLDFLSYDRHTPTVPTGFIYQPDNFLTVEFALMEYYTTLSATSNSPDQFWCDAAARPELLCLDIGAPSTLGNSLNHTAGLAEPDLLSNGLLIYKVQATADSESTQLFGQALQCNGRVVGDGVINVFDISTLMSYLFSDWMYRNLSPDPVQVLTVEGRTGVLGHCGHGMSRLDFMMQYASDPCIMSDHQGVLIQNASSGRRLEQQSQQGRKRIGVEVHENVGIVFDAPVYMAFVKVSCHINDCIDTSHLQTTKVYKHPNGFAVSRSLTGDTVNDLVIPFATLVTTATIDYRHTRVYLSPTDEYEIIPRTMHKTHKRFLVSQVGSGVQGSWHTFSIPGVPLRLHMVFKGITIRSIPLSRSVWSPIAKSTQPAEVRITRKCESDDCSRCSSVLTGLSNNVAVFNGTLELLQMPILGACAFDVHIFHSGDQPISVQYTVMTDFSSHERPDWSHFSCVDRRFWSPLLSTISPSPPPPLPSRNPIALVFTVVFCTCILSYVCCFCCMWLPYPLCTRRRCSNCRRRSTLCRPFEKDKCPRCLWIEEHRQA